MNSWAASQMAHCHTKEPHLRTASTSIQIIAPCNLGQMRHDKKTLKQEWIYIDITGHRRGVTGHRRGRLRQVTRKCAGADG